jgi:FkbM family methyltransferase
MTGTAQQEKLSTIAKLIRESHGELTFTIFDIGAVPIGDGKELFHLLPVLFPGSRIIAFELDQELCRSLNETAGPGLRYYPVALGRRTESRLLYETMHPMCTSLYCPDSDLLRRYNDLEVVGLKKVSFVQTTGLDEFAQQNGLEPDFIKIDIQGAELDVFEGGEGVLENVVGIVSEVEFVPLYMHQPLFGDVCKFLTNRNFMFHKFLGFGGRTLSPFLMGDNPGAITQHLWSDAMFIRDIRRLTDVTGQQLLKMGVISVLYGSPDVSYYCFHEYDRRNSTTLHNQIFDIVQ